uniref:Uncharacterized protein n=1 Tax=Aquila chrysaetos chrysaetos TaxID=223781 RepID=A0A663EZ04_AQUCH
GQLGGARGGKYFSTLKMQLGQRDKGGHSYLHIGIRWDPYLNLDPRCPEQGADEFTFPTGAKKSWGRLELAFFTIGGCYKTGTALVCSLNLGAVLWGHTRGFLDLLYGALGVITEETQGAEDDPDTTATGTGTSKRYRTISPCALQKPQLDQLWK